MSQYQYTGCRLWCRIILAVIGILLGLSAGIPFLIVFQNYHVGSWALVSAVFAAITLALHLIVYKDMTFALRPDIFLHLKIVGIFGSLLGAGVFIGYLIKGILVHEHGVQVHGWFIVCVWGWMTFKWGFLLFWFAKNYLIGLNQEIGSILSLNSGNVNT